MEPPKNQFQGINPVLQTILQTPGMPIHHQAFHGSEISHLADLLSAKLFQQGYYAVSEQNVSLGSHFFRPDVSVVDKSLYGERPKLALQDQTLLINEPTLTTTAPLPSPTRSLFIYSKFGSNTFIPVTAIEILSPSNVEGSGVETYLHKRSHLLQVGIHLVELHYLNAFPPILEYMPLYPYDLDSQAFHIAVTRADNRDEEGKYLSDVYLFGVDIPIPTIKIPLLDDDMLVFDFNYAYQHTYENGFWGQHVHYNNLPPTMAKMFRQDDYQKIIAKIQQILDSDSDSTSE